MFFSGHYDPDMWCRIAKSDRMDWEWYRVESYRECLIEDVVVESLSRMKILIGVVDGHTGNEYLLVIKGRILSSLLLQQMDFTLESITETISTTGLETLLSIVKQYVSKLDQITFHFSGIKTQE